MKIITFRCQSQGRSLLNLQSIEIPASQCPGGLLPALLELVFLPLLPSFSLHAIWFPTGGNSTLPMFLLWSACFASYSKSTPKLPHTQLLISEPISSLHCFFPASSHPSYDRLLTAPRLCLRTFALSYSFWPIVPESLFLMLVHFPCLRYLEGSHSHLDPGCKAHLHHSCFCLLQFSEGRHLSGMLLAHKEDMQRMGRGPSSTSPIRCFKTIKAPTLEKHTAT